MSALSQRFQGKNSWIWLFTELCQFEILACSYDLHRGGTILRQSCVFQPETAVTHCILVDLAQKVVQNSPYCLTLLWLVNHFFGACNPTTQKIHKESLTSFDKAVCQRKRDRWDRQWWWKLQYYHMSITNDGPSAQDIWCKECWGIVGAGGMKQFFKAVQSQAERLTKEKEKVLAPAGMNIHLESIILLLEHHY